MLYRMKAIFCIYNGIALLALFAFIGMKPVVKFRFRYCPRGLVSSNPVTAILQATFMVTLLIFKIHNFPLFHKMKIHNLINQNDNMKLIGLAEFVNASKSTKAQHVKVVNNGVDGQPE